MLADTENEPHVITFTSLPSVNAVPESVIIMGSFDHWKEQHEMEMISLSPRTFAFNLDRFLPELSLNEAKTNEKGQFEIQYKFKIDGHWTLDEQDKTKECLRDDEGNLNHVVYLTAPFEARRNTIAGLQSIANSREDLTHKGFISQKLQKFQTSENASDFGQLASESQVPQSPKSATDKKTRHHGGCFIL